MNFPENNPILPLASPVTLAFRSNQRADALPKTGGFLPCVDDAMNDGIAQFVDGVAKGANRPEGDVRRPQSNR